MEIKMVRISEIVPYKNNPRKNTAAVEPVKQSIKEFGFKVPMILDRDNVIVTGHTRFKAAQELGMKEVPVIYADDLTEAQIRAFRLADNKTNEFAEWDEELLGLELDDLADIDMSLFGFDLENDDPEQVEVFEDDIPQNAEERCSPGDVWELGKHRLICGDSTNTEVIERLMDGQKADMVMTDPPYGINADSMTMGTGKRDFHRGEWDDTRPQLNMAFSLAKNVCIWGGNYFTDVLPISNDWLVWWKKNDGLSFSECELAWTNFGRNVRHIAHHWGNEKKLHVTMKPVSVMAWAIQQAKDEAENIVDLFGGSGSTLIACEQIGRRCFICERDPKFCDVIIDRWERFTGEKAIQLS